MKIRIIEKFFNGYQYYYKVNVNGKKFPIERDNYWVFSEDNDQTAIDLSVAESRGYYISRGGLIYKSYEEYENNCNIDNWLDKGFPTRAKNLNKANPMSFD